VLVHTLGICCLELGDTKYGLLMVKAVRWRFHLPSCNPVTWRFTALAIQSAW
jgi:hypothetical protein